MVKHLNNITNILLNCYKIIIFLKKNKTKLNMKTEKKDILSGTIKTPKRKKLMGRFDNDKPFQISTILDDGEFVLRLKDNKFIFKNNDKSFEIYIEK